MLGKIKRAKDKIRAAGSDLLDSTTMKFAGRQFRVNGKKYKAKKLIAEGGFGYVYLVEDEMTGQLRALKHMIMQTRESRESTLREIELHNALPQSPYLVAILGSEVVRGPPDEAFVVMDLCTGGNLADVINVAGPGGRGLPESRIWEIFFQVCMAVSILHEQNPVVIHRDIKAENVLIHEDGTYKLCDFGSATREMVFPSSDTTRNAIQEDIDRFTTMVYRSPEMVDLYMEKWIGDKVDIWALGCLLFKMAYVVTPFEEGGRLGILNARVEFPQTLNSASYSDNLRSTIRWLLTPDPEERPHIFQVLERVSKYARTSYSSKGKIAPQHPPDPAGFGSSLHSSSAHSHSQAAPASSARGQLFEALDWQPSTTGSAPPGTFQSDSKHSRSGSAPFSDPNAFFPSANPSNNSGSSSFEDFFASPTQADSPQIQFAPAPSSSSAWASFDSFDTSMQASASSQSLANSSGSAGSNAFHPHSGDDKFAFPAPTSASSNPPQIVAPPQQSSTTASSKATSSSSSSSSFTARTHRRSVSDSSALAASLATMNFSTAHDPAFHQNLSNAAHIGTSKDGRKPVLPDSSVLTSLVSSFISSNVQIPSLAIARDIITYTWTPPRQPFVSKIFQTLAPKLGSAAPAVTSLKGMHLIHRLLAEGSDCVLTLCLNKLDYFKNLASGFESAATSEFMLVNDRYAHYLLKKLEFHHAFEGCFEGSYSLDAYFQKLRADGKKLQIGAADSPVRRQAVSALLDLQLSAISLAEQCLTPTPNNPDASSLKLRLCLPTFSDICALLLLLQYVTTKLLATKTDFTKAILQYEEQYAKIVALFAKFSIIATAPLNVGFSAVESSWAQTIKLPSFPPTAPAITKGATNVASPPSLDYAVSGTLSSDRFPTSIIHDNLSSSDQTAALWTWHCFVVAQSESNLSSAFNTPPSAVFQSSASSSQNRTTSAQQQQATAPQVTIQGATSFDSPTFSPNAPSFAPAFELDNNGFSQGDPFATSSAPGPSNPISRSMEIFPTSSLSMSQPSGPQLVPSTSYGSMGNASTEAQVSSSSPPPAFEIPQFQPGATPPFLSRSTRSQNRGEPEMMSAPTPKRALAQSADVYANPNQLPVPSNPAPRRHQKQKSADHSQPSAAPMSTMTPQKALQTSKLSHSSSGSSNSSSSSGFRGQTDSPSFQTSEDKLKDKDRMNAQAQEFSAILATRGNNMCFDCGDVSPKWLSLNLGVFICYRCAGVHRSFGSHISKVRSVELDVLTPEQIAFFRRMGNEKAAEIWLAHVPNDRTEPDRNTAQSELERFLRDKYVFEEFKDK